MHENCVTTTVSDTLRKKGRTLIISTAEPNRLHTEGMPQQSPRRIKARTPLLHVNAEKRKQQEETAVSTKCISVYSVKTKTE
jgi:hypothetical protein